MSTTTTTGSAFRNLDVGSDADRPPVSTLAILALGIGLLSLIAPISFYLLPLSIIAIAIGSLALWRIGRDSAVGGAWLAQCGLGLGVISSVWCLTASVGSAAYLHNEAARNAKIYLETLASGQVYQALELHVPKPNRQIAGTDLASHYRSKTGETADLALEILNSPSTKAVVASGPKSNWQLYRGLDIQDNRGLQTINIEMRNEAQPSQIAKVTLSRRYYVDESGQSVAFWNIERVEVPSAMEATGITTTSNFSSL